MSLGNKEQLVFSQSLASAAATGIFLEAAPTPFALNSMAPSAFFLPMRSRQRMAPYHDYQDRFLTSSALAEDTYDAFNDAYASWLSLPTNFLGQVTPHLLERLGGRGGGGGV
jgi:hypothetical protein